MSCTFISAVGSALVSRTTGSSEACLAKCVPNSHAAVWRKCLVRRLGLGKGEIPTTDLNSSRRPYIYSPRSQCYVLSDNFTIPLNKSKHYPRGFQKLCFSPNTVK